MTREEIIKGLGEISVCQIWEDEVIDEAIKALKQELCEDVISRQTVIDAIDKWVKDKHILVALPTDEVTPLFEGIHELSSVNSQELKTGHWYYDEEREATGIYAICSNCDEKIYQTGDFKYCPNCGARMEKEGDKE